MTRFQRGITELSQDVQEIDVYVLGNVESLTASTDILQVFSFLHHVPWISTLDSHSIAASLKPTRTGNKLISKFTVT